MFPKIEPIIRNICAKMQSRKLEWLMEAIPTSPSAIPLGSPPQPATPEQQKAVLATKAVNAIGQACLFQSVIHPTVFRNAIIGGIGVSRVYINSTQYDTEEIIVENVNPKYIVIDPTFTDPTLKDARWMAVRRNYTIPEAIETFAMKEQDDGSFQVDEDAVATISAYKYTVDVLFKDTPEYLAGNYPLSDQYLIPVIEFYEKRRFLVYALYDENGLHNAVTLFDTPQEAQQELTLRMQTYQQMWQEAVQVNPAIPEPVPPQIKPKKVVRVVYTNFLGTNSFLSETVLDQDHFPFEFSFPYFNGGDFWGFAEQLAPNQKMLDRMMTQLDFLIRVAAKSGKVVRRDLLEDPQDPEQIANQLSRTGFVLFAKIGADPKDVIYDVEGHPSISSVITDIMQIFLQGFDTQYSAVGYMQQMPGAQGGSPQQSGVAIKNQQTANDIGTLVWDEADKLYFQQTGEHILYALQKWATKPMMLQYLGRDNAAEWVSVNSAPNSDDSLYDERFNVRVTDRDFAPTEKARMNAQWQAMLAQVPPGTPLWIQVFIEYIRTGDWPEDAKAVLIQAATAMMMPPMGQVGPGQPPQAPQGPPASPSL